MRDGFGTLSPTDEEAKRSRVLTVLPDLPLPADTGLHLRMLGNLEVVRALGAESHVLCFSTEDRAQHLELLPEVATLCDSLTYAGPRRSQEKFTRSELIREKLGYGARGLMNRPSATYPFAMRYDAVSGLQKTLDECKRVRPYAVVLPSFLLHWAPSVRATGAMVIADAIDILTDLTHRLMRATSLRNPLARVSLASNYWAERSQERLFFPDCAEAWVTSTAEAARVSAVSPATKTVVIPNTVDEPANDSVADIEFGRVGFIGTYTSEPNLVSARRLATRIWPLVRAEFPEGTLALAGAGMPAGDARALAAIPGVEVLGRVESSAAFIRSCQVLALPIEVRGGVPLKLVEALALNRPVVASPELVMGLPLHADVEVLVGQGDRQFADAIGQLLVAPQKSIAVAAAGRQAYDRYFSREAMIRNAANSSILAGS